MILILKGADFSSHNIGTLDSYFIQFSPNSGIASHNVPTSIKKNTSLSATITIKEGYELGTAGVTVTMGGNPVTSNVTTSGNTITIYIPSVNGNVAINVPTKNISTGEPEAPDTGENANTATYLINTNIFSDGKYQEGPGRIAIVEFFPTNGKDLTVSTSLPTTTIAKRYYKADKEIMASGAADSVYGRVVLVLGTATLTEDYNGETLTVNGVKYTLKSNYEPLPSDNLKFQVNANINADGLVDTASSSANGRVAILDFIPSLSKAASGSYQNAEFAVSPGVAFRYYSDDKSTIVSAIESTYFRVVLYGSTLDTIPENIIEGTKITINSREYTLTNN